MNGLMESLILISLFKSESGDRERERRKQEGGKEGEWERERGKEREREGEGKREISTLLENDLSVGHQLATGGRCQLGWHCKETLHDRGKGTRLTFLSDKEMENHVLLQCTKGKDKCTCYEEAIDIENSSFGRRERKKAYPSSHNGSYYKEMTEYKCSRQPSIINNERRSLEALNQNKSNNFCIFF